MPVDKRQRVLKALALEAPDIVPVHSLGYDRTRRGYADFMNSPFPARLRTIVDGIGDVTEIRWWNADAWQMHPYTIFTSELYPTPPGMDGCELHFTGRIYKAVPGIHDDPFLEASHIPWYIGGHFTSPGVVHELWAAHGKPSDRLNEGEDYSPARWHAYVDSLAGIVFPMAWLTLSMHEALYAGVTPARLAYFMRKDPGFVHELMGEYCRTNLEVITRFAEAGVEVVFYSDDLGQHGRSLLSKKDFREFILPYYARMYAACRKHDMFIVQHSCGCIDELLPDLIAAGLSCVQSLEPTAGVDLARLKARHGNEIAFMGGMDSSRILSFGTPEDVAANVRACMEAAARGGGYFAGPSHTILDAPWANVLAFRDAIERYRRCYGNG